MGIQLRNTLQFLMLKRLYKQIYFLAAIFILLGVKVWGQDSSMGDLKLSPNDRILVLAPHPDDEVLGAGGVIQKASSMKLPIKIVFFTYGDSNQWSFFLYRKHPVFMPGAVESMGLIRNDEAVTASNILGVDSKDLVFLGYPDFGTLHIWYEHWNKRAPYRSMLTRVTNVPYQGAFRPGAAYKGEEIISDLRAIIKDFKPTKIFISHPADHNGDHLSLYLYMRVALWDEQMADKVEMYPYLIHYIGWPKHKGFKPNYLEEPPEALSKINKWDQYRLSQQEFDLKKGALQAHKSQYASALNTFYLLFALMRFLEIFLSLSCILMKIPLFLARIGRWFLRLNCRKSLIL